MGEEALASQGITEELLARRWEAALSASRPAGSALLVALHANTIVGFALAGPDEAVDTSSGHGPAGEGSSSGPARATWNWVPPAVRSRWVQGPGRATITGTGSAYPGGASRARAASCAASAQEEADDDVDPGPSDQR